MSEINLNEYATRSDVAVILGVSTGMLREMEKKGEGPPVVRFSSRKALYPNTGLIQYIKSRTVGGVA